MTIGSSSSSSSSSDDDDDGGYASGKLGQWQNWLDLKLRKFGRGLDHRWWWRQPVNTGGGDADLDEDQDVDSSSSDDREEESS